MHNQKIHSRWPFFLFSFLILANFVPKPTYTFMPNMSWIIYDDTSQNDQYFFSLGYANSQDKSHGVGLGFHYDIDPNRKGFPYVRGTVFWDQALPPMQRSIISNRTFDQQFSLSLEWHDQQWSLHTNIYLPSSSTYKTQPATQEIFTGLDGYQLGFLQYHHQPSQSATPGIDIRLARWWQLLPDLSLYTEIVNYGYMIPGDSFVQGNLAGTTLSWTLPQQDWSINFSVQERVDDLKDHELYAGVQVRIPLWQPPKANPRVQKTWKESDTVVDLCQTTMRYTTPTKQRPILRRYGIEYYDHIVTTYSFSPAINPLTQRPYGKVIFVAQNGKGDGTESSPTSLSQAMSMADDDGIIVMDGRSGSIHSTQPITIGSYAMVVGGGYRFLIQDGQGRRGLATLGQKSSPIFIDQPHQPALTLQGYAQAHSIDITGGSTGIYIQDGSHKVILSNVEVGGTKAAGIRINPSDAVLLKNCRIRHTSTEGIIARKIDNLQMENVTITNTRQTGLIAEESHQINLKNITIQGSFSDGIALKNNNQVTLDYLSVDETWGHGLVVENSEQIQSKQVHLHNHGGHGLWLKGSIDKSQWALTQIYYTRQDAIRVGAATGHHIFDDVDIHESCVAGLHYMNESILNIKNLDIETKQGVGIQITENMHNVFIDRGNINKNTWTDYRLNAPIIVGYQNDSASLPPTIQVTTHRPSHPNSYLFNKTTWKSTQDYFFKKDNTFASDYFFGADTNKALTVSP